jgi:hypothetical protein
MYRRPSTSHDSSSLVLLSVLVVSTLAGCDKKKSWDWREHFAVDCSVIVDRGAVYVHAKDDLPEGTVVEVAALPGLNDTINPSRIYMTDTSLVPLPAGSQTLTFNATSGDETASTTCAIERPVFTAQARPVTGESEPFARAQLIYSIAVKGQEPGADTRVVVPLLPDGNLGVSFQAWQPEPLAGAAAFEVDDRGVFRIPVPATEGAEIEFGFRNPDSQSASYTLRVVSARPWADDDLNALYAEPGSGYTWAADVPPVRAKGDPISAILVDPRGEVLGHVGPMRTLSELERVAHVAISEVVVETCKYRAPDGVEATIDRVAERGEIVLRVAKTGAEITRKTVEGKPPPCPDSAEFTVTYDEQTANGQAWDQARTGEVAPVALAWFEIHSQR